MAHLRVTDRQTDQPRWRLAEKLQILIKIAVDDMPGLYGEPTEPKAPSATVKNFREAAIYCLTSKSHLDQGLVWAQRAVSDPANGVENMQTLTVLAECQLASGMTEVGMKTMDKALARPDATPIDIHQAARFQQMSGNKDLAIKLFQYNAKRFPNVWPTTLGLARSYALAGTTPKQSPTPRSAASGARRDQQKERRGPDPAVEHDVCEGELGEHARRGSLGRLLARLGGSSAAVPVDPARPPHDRRQQDEHADRSDQERVVLVGEHHVEIHVERRHHPADDRGPSCRVQHRAAIGRDLRHDRRGGDRVGGQEARCSESDSSSK